MSPLTLAHAPYPCGELVADHHVVEGADPTVGEVVAEIAAEHHLVGIAAEALLAETVEEEHLVEIVAVAHLLAGIVAVGHLLVGTAGVEHLPVETVVEEHLVEIVVGAHLPVEIAVEELLAGTVEGVVEVEDDPAAVLIVGTDWDLHLEEFFVVHWPEQPTGALSQGTSF